MTDTLPASAGIPPMPEQRAREEYLARKAARPLVPRFVVKTTRSGKVKVVPDQSGYTDKRTGGNLVANALGTTSQDFGSQIVEQLVNATRHPSGMPNERALNAALAAVQAVQPRDEVEAQLAVQMAMIHHAMASTAARLAGATNTDQFAIYEGALNRLARTAVAQVEGLKRHRSTGEQRMVVQHVTVEDGAQAAFVGTVNQGGGGGR